MHVGEWLYVMLALFAVTIMYSTYTTVIEMRYHRKIIEETPRKTCFLLIDIPIPLTDWRV